MKNMSVKNKVNNTSGVICFKPGAPLYRALRFCWPVTPMCCTIAPTLFDSASCCSHIVPRRKWMPKSHAFCFYSAFKQAATCMNRCFAPDPNFCSTCSVSTTVATVRIERHNGAAANAPKQEHKKKDGAVALQASPNSCEEARQYSHEAGFLWLETQCRDHHRRLSLHLWLVQVWSAWSWNIRVSLYMSTCSCAAV